MYQRYYLGKDSIRNLINEVEYYRPNSVFLVRGKKSYESCGAQSVINNALVSLNLNVVEFWDFETNPKMEDLQILHTSLLFISRYNHKQSLALVIQASHRYFFHQPPLPASSSSSVLPNSAS